LSVFGCLAKYPLKKESGFLYLYASNNNYMFKEHSANKLIEYIQTLPFEEQKLIAEHIADAKNGTRKKKANVSGPKKGGLKEMGAFLDSLGNKLPANYKFNREEARL
jgi:hypothetical protein